MSKECLVVMDQTIPYTIRISDRAKRLRVAVYLDGDVVVTQPQHTSKAHLKKFIESKKYWIMSKLDQNNKVTNADLKDTSLGHFTNNKSHASSLMALKVAHWAKILGCEYGEIRIKQLKSRWGSCSSKGDLTFNYRVIFLSNHLQDYIVVHELCHIKQPNHSKKFWSLVQQTLPNYQQLKSEVKRI